MPKIIGLTGGIGSGKSTISAFFSALGVPVYIADAEAKKIMQRPEIIKDVQNIFNENVVDEKGNLNRKKIASIVFNDPVKLDALNQIIHPAVKQDFLLWLEKHKNQKYVIKEVAIIFEIKSEKDFDKIILITAPEQERIRRVMLRDGVSAKQVLERMRNQLPESDKVAKSDFIIDNIDLNIAKKKVEEIHRSINLI
ncbi:MAG TPA: dephospho-CoA kinase [Flavobacterium sp.]|nr:dephospho-CoA kinase [Flavobacterium sp.]